MVVFLLASFEREAHLKRVPSKTKTQHIYIYIYIVYIYIHMYNIYIYIYTGRCIAYGLSGWLFGPDNFFFFFFLEQLACFFAANAFLFISCLWSSFHVSHGIQPRVP